MGGGGDVRYGRRQLCHFLVAGLELPGGVLGRLSGIRGIVGGLIHLSGNFMDTGGQLLDCRSLLYIAIGQGLGICGHALRFRGYLFGRQVDLEQGIVQSVQNLAHGVLDGKEFPSIVVPYSQVHVALGHLSQDVVDVHDVFFELALCLVDGCHQHSDFGSVGLQRELRRQVAHGDFFHLVFHGKNRAHDDDSGDDHVQQLYDAHHGQGEEHAEADGVLLLFQGM